MDAPDPAVLREYALIADGCRGILIGPQGDMAWGCFPRWDSDAVFSGLLGGAGFYLVRPRARHSWGGYYERETLIWRSRWVTNDADIECREALAYPGDPKHAVVLRRLTTTRGSAAVDIGLQLRRSFGDQSPRELERDDNGAWTMRLGDLYVRWSGVHGARFDRRSDTFVATLELPPQEHFDLVLELGTDPLEAPKPAQTHWEATEKAWRQALPDLGDTIAPRDAGHAAAVLRGLTFPSGAMVAAATMALPERAGAGRDYDYRYAWIRDQCIVGEAAAAVGDDHLLDAAVRFVSGRVLDDGPQLRPAYTVVGEQVPGQRPLDLPGYPGSPDVVAGNRAGEQFQLDVFGEVLLLLAAAAERDRLDTEGWRAVAAAAGAIATRRDEPDFGVWEAGRRRYAHSRLTCAAGLRRIATVATPGPATGEWTALADSLLAETAADSVHPSGRWQRALDDSRVDAALLVPQLRGLLPHDDPRSAATRNAVCEELLQDGYVYRFSLDSEPLGVEEGAFMLCGYWLAMSLCDAGDVTAGRALFERSRAGCGPPGLFAEEYDVIQRQLRGNLPQAFVHATMLEAASRLAR